jgi:hypothetical protein
VRQHAAHTRPALPTMRAPAIIAALMATAATHNASGVPAGGASALLAFSITTQVRLDSRSARGALAPAADATRATAGWRGCALAQHSWHILSCALPPRVRSRAAASRRHAALGRLSVRSERRVRCARALLRTMPCRAHRDCRIARLPSGVADANRASAPCALSDGRDVAWGDSYLCACVDCAGGGAGCVQKSWSAACDGDAPCRAPDGTIGTMRDGRVCITRQGAASGFQQLCVAGSAAPSGG